jgi:hypothetical protein
MASNNVLILPRREERSGFRSAIFEPDAAETESNTFRIKGVTLIVALMLSLGLWAIIGIAVAALFASGPV